MYAIIITQYFQLVIRKYRINKEIGNFLKNKPKSRYYEIGTILASTIFFKNQFIELGVGFRQVGVAFHHIVKNQ